MQHFGCDPYGKDFQRGELPEVLGMSDRVLVMKDNAIVAELTGEDINPVEVMRYAL